MTHIIPKWNVFAFVMTRLPLTSCCSTDRRSKRPHRCCHLQNNWLVRYSLYFTMGRGIFKSAVRRRERALLLPWTSLKFGGEWAFSVARWSRSLEQPSGRHPDNNQQQLSTRNLKLLFTKFLWHYRSLGFSIFVSYFIAYRYISCWWAATVSCIVRY